ncbi:MAG: PrsW family glutamic-type intramembrane protease [Planctomycetota bacterium]
MPDREPSADREPHPADQPAAGDPSEQAADRVLRRRRTGPTDREELSRHSVFDEPDIFPGRAPETIEQDWSCDNCGYNLRGLPTGHRCPECGHIELYRPPPPGEASLGDWFRKKQAVVSSSASWWAVVLAAVLGGPWAVLGTMFVAGVPHLLFVAVMGPAAEEVMKLAAIAVLVEVRPWLIKREEQIRVAAIGSALAFAVIENLLYLKWYIAAPSFGIVLWRWIVCTGLHVTCTWIAVGGLVAAWRHVNTEARVIRRGEAIRGLAFAIILHGTYNAAITFLQFSGVIF